MESIKILIDDITLYAELFDTETAKAIMKALPIQAVPNEWGDEFYFEIPVNMPLDVTATSNVRVGDIGYWPPGHALAIFYGPTPASTGEEPIPASDVNIVGRITGDSRALKKAKGADRVRIEKSLNSSDSG